MRIRVQAGPIRDALKTCLAVLPEAERVAFDVAGEWVVVHAAGCDYGWVVRVTVQDRTHAVTMDPKDASFLVRFLARFEDDEYVSFGAAVCGPSDSRRLVFTARCGVESVRISE